MCVNIYIVSYCMSQVGILCLLHSLVGNLADCFVTGRQGVVSSNSVQQPLLHLHVPGCCITGVSYGHVLAGSAMLQTASPVSLESWSLGPDQNS